MRKYRFATQEEGRKLKLANTDYLEALTQNDIDWKLQSSGQSLEEFKAFAAEQIGEFTDEEKRAISKVMDFIRSRVAELGFCLPISDEIVFIKTAMGDEGHMGGYTQKNEIYLSADEAEYLTRAFHADPEFDADYLEYLIHFGRGLISHEIFHCLTRNTDYICVPEECLAENFSFLIAYGFFGRYDLTLDTRKVLFVPYSTPALIRGIHTTLLEHFPKKD